jgi:hypothetical protein
VVLTGATVGTPIPYDLCAVFRDTFAGSPSLLQLQPAIRPPQLPIETAQEYHARLTLQAKSVEIDSDPLIVTIDWNGQWNDDSGQMAINLVVATLQMES